MKNIILFLLSFTSVLAVSSNPTAPITELQYYGADFTDTDGDGMTDVAELKYGFDPNDSNSFPSTDYTFLYEDGRPELYQSTGVTDVKNQVLFQFTKADYITNRSGQSNLEKLKSDREFLNLAMPILLHELGVPPESFIIEIRCINRGVYSNGFKISVNDDSPPSSFLHEIGHAWKSGWTYSFMKGAFRRHMRGFEEGFAEALVYHIQNRFVEAYPNHPLVKSKMVTSRNAQTWRGDVYNFDVNLGERSLMGGTFWSDKFTQYRYENSSGVFTVMANQREGALRDLMQAYYKKIAEGNWDRTLNVQETFDVWANVLPTINGIETQKWLTKVGLLSGKPAPQDLYVSLIDDKVFVKFPDHSGNFSWKTTNLSSLNIPNWFPTKNVNGTFYPNVEGLDFNLNIKTINNEVVYNGTKKLSSKSLGLTEVSETKFAKLPVGLYRANVSVPVFKGHTKNYQTDSYLIGGRHVIIPHDRLSIHVGVDAPDVTDVSIVIEQNTYTTDFRNGLAIFEIEEFGIDYTGPITISVSSAHGVNEYTRVISHFGLGSGQRLNQFVITDSDFDSVEDKFDSNIVSLSYSINVPFASIDENAEQLSKFTTILIEDETDGGNTTDVPNLPDEPTAPPSTSNPIDDLVNQIKDLEEQVLSLINKNVVLVNEKESLETSLNASNETIKNLEAEIVLLNNEVKLKSNQIAELIAKLKNESNLNAEHSQRIKVLENKNNELFSEVEKLNTTIQNNSNEHETALSNLNGVVNDLNKTIHDMNKTIVQLESNATALKAELKNATDSNELVESEKSSLITQLEDASSVNESLLSQIKSLETENDLLVKEVSNTNTKLSETTDSANLTYIKLTEVIVDMNQTIVDLNTTLLSLEVNASNLELELNKTLSEKKSVETENETLIAKVKELEAKLLTASEENAKLVESNANLTIQLEDSNGDYQAVVQTNVSLNNTNEELTSVNEKLTSELNEAIRVAQIPFIDDWFYDPEDGWLYTDAEMFPLVYKHSDKSWYYYELGSSKPRYFYSYKTKEWQTWD